MGKITPFLWFDNQIEEAMELYGKVFKDFKLKNKQDLGGGILVCDWEMNGQDFMGMNAGPSFKFNEAVSFYVDCDGQEEVDHYWNALTADGGKEDQCGWLKDKFGLSWQIIPKQLIELQSGPNGQKVAECMLKQHKIIISELEEAAKG